MIVLDEYFANKLAERKKADEEAAYEVSKNEVAHFPARPCVLVVDDEVQITSSISTLLGTDFDVQVAKSVDEALEILKHNNISVVITDQRMPGGTGAELLSRSLDLSPETTRILFTGYSDISAVIEAVNEGQIYRYITKPWRSEELKLTVTQGVERYRLIVENRTLLDELRTTNASLELRVAERTRSLQEQNAKLRAAQARIEELSRKDPLTGLTNRRWLDEILHTEVNRARNEQVDFSVVMIDLDFFKTVNDTFGHAVGDRVLCAVAEQLNKTVRLPDTVGRYGGEEFLVLLPNTNLQTAQNVAEKMRDAFFYIPLTFRTEPLTASFGVAQWAPGDSAASLVDRADGALYSAKHAGRNKVVSAEGGGMSEQTFEQFFAQHRNDILASSSTRLSEMESMSRVAASRDMSVSEMASSANSV